MTVKIRRALPNEVARYYARQPVEHHGLFVDGEPVALGGFQIRGDRTYAYLDVTPEVVQHGARVARAALRALMDRNETIYAPCAAHDQPKAERLLTWLGFRPTDDVFETGRGITMRIWQWQRWPF